MLEGFEEYCKNSARGIPKFGGIIGLPSTSPRISFGQKTAALGLNYTKRYKILWNRKKLQLAMIEDSKGYAITVTKGAVSLQIKAFATHFKIEGKYAFSHAEKVENAYVFTCKKK